MKWLVALAVMLSSSIVYAQAGMHAQRPEDPTETIERLTPAIRAHDAKAIAKFLHTKILIRGLWFPDAACTKQFGKPRTLGKRDHAAFAKCLAKLELQASTRNSPDGGAQLITYAPGIELLLGFYDGALYYAGYAHPKPSATPSLTAQAFEALRKTGTTNVDSLVAAKLDPEVARGRGLQVAAWIDVCVDATGATKLTVAEASSPEIGAVLAAAAADWTFSPFTHGKHTLAICSLSLLTYPSAKAPTIELLPDWYLPDVTEVDGTGPGGVPGGVDGDGSVWLPGVGHAWPPAPPPPPPPPPPTRK